MGIVSFKKDDLRNLLDDDCETLERVSDSITGKSRWSVDHVLVFRDKASGKFYGTAYSVGATEQQDERPFEYDGDVIECAEMRAVEKVVVVYERVA